MNDEKRSNFTGKLGFVLAAAGSAVGLGNIWRFPYLAAKYGGGIFLLVYVILALTFGFALMTAEITIGRKTGLSAVGAFKSLSRRFAFLGYLESIVPMIILPYYCVIGGWVAKYLAAFVSGSAKAAADGKYFGNFIEKTGEPIMWFVIYCVLTAIVVAFGVEKGVENVSKIMMPILVILSVFIAVYTMFLPGAMDGVFYYITPDFTKFSAKTVLAAMGQMFYSMSLAMGIMITYGSYMKKDVSIDSSVKQIELFDTGIAFIAGLMIIPAVFVFSGGNEEALQAGPSLMFITLPQVFDSIRGGAVLGGLFFLLVLFAALTSSISLMETVVSIVQDKLRLKRVPACVLVLFGMLLIGLSSALGFSAWSNITIFKMSFLDFFDFISNNIIMPIVAFFTCIIVAYIIKPKSLIEEIETGGVKFKRAKLFSVVIKYIAPVCIILILLSSLLSAFGIMSL